MRHCWGKDLIKARIYRSQSRHRLTRTLMKQDTVFCIAHCRIQAEYQPKLCPQPMQTRGTLNFT
jgi:hypothetical protein